MMLWGWNFVPFKSAINNLQTQVDELRADLDAHINAEPESEPEPEPVPFPGIQAAYDALPAGATELVIPAGEYTEELRLHREGVALVPDGEVTIIGRVYLTAHRPWIQHGITIREGESLSEQYHGCIEAVNVDGVQFDGAVTGASWAGINIKGGTGHLLSKPIAYENGALGIRLDSVDDTIVDSPTCFANNTKGANPGWEAGGIKVIGNYGGVRNVQVIDGHFHHNDGPGIWFDVDAEDCLATGNLVHHNTRAGIIYELSRRGTITDNKCYENGWGFRDWGFGAGVLIQNSKDCIVRRNICAWNPDGIVVISQDRGQARWNDVTGNQVDDNIIAHVDGNEQYGSFAGAVVEFENPIAVQPGSGNTGQRNLYWFSQWETSRPADTNGPWIMRGRNGDKAYYGIPEIFGGSLMSRGDLNTVLTEAGIPLEPER